MPAVAGESILIHAGDATMFSRPPSSIDRFNDWLGSLPYTYKVFVPGNHEGYIEEGGANSPSTPPSSSTSLPLSPVLSFGVHRSCLLVVRRSA